METIPFERIPLLVSEINRKVDLLLSNSQVSNQQQERDKLLTIGKNGQIDHLIAN